MVTGSLASTHHGRPRSTHDVDLVIDPQPGVVGELVALLHDAGFYVNAETATAAMARRRQFNAIHTASGVKLDLIVRKDRPHSVEELSRRCLTEIGGGTPVMLASAEDCILSKLEWARRAGRSEKQLADVAGVLEVQGDRLDLSYIDCWAVPLGVVDLWNELRSRHFEAER
jgi:hypothetical protein